MSDGILSQEEIDALLGGAGGGEGAPEEGAASEFDMDPVGEVLRVAMEASVEGLADVLQMTGSLEPGELQFVPFGAEVEKIGGAHFAVEVEMRGAVSGLLLFGIPLEFGVWIGEMMLGSDGGETMPNDANLSGLREALEEMSAQLSAAFSTILAADIRLGALEPNQVDFSSADGLPVPIAPEEDVMYTPYQVTMGERAWPLHAFMPFDVAGAILDLLAEGVEEEPEATPAPSSAPTRPVTVAPGEPSRESDSEPVNVAQVREAHFDDLGRKTKRPGQGNLDFLLDVPLHVTVELGRTRMQIREILELGRGSVVELDKLAGEPVEIFVNSKLIAKGEVVTIDENFGVKITDIVSKQERVNNLGERD